MFLKLNLLIIPMKLSMIWVPDMFYKPHTLDTLDHHLKGKLSIRSPMS